MQHIHGYPQVLLQVDQVFIQGHGPRLADEHGHNADTQNRADDQHYQQFNNCKTGCTGPAATEQR